MVSPSDAGPASDSSFCHRCGKVLIANSIYCSKCGTEIPPESSALSSSPRASTAPRGMSKGAIVAIVLSSFTAVVSISLYGIFLGLSADVDSRQDLSDPDVAIFQRVSDASSSVWKKQKIVNQDNKHHLAIYITPDYTSDVKNDTGCVLWVFDSVEAANDASPLMYRDGHMMWIFPSKSGKFGLMLSSWQPTNTCVQDVGNVFGRDFTGPGE